MRAGLRRFPLPPRRGGSRGRLEGAASKIRGTSGTAAPERGLSSTADPLPGDHPKPGRSVREGLLIAVTGAVATSVVAALLSPSTMGAVLDFLTGDDGDGASTSSLTSTPRDDRESPGAATAFKTASSPDGAVTIHVPATWGFRRSGWNLSFVRTPQGGYQSGMAHPGSAVQAGTGTGLGPDSGSILDTETLWLGASSEAATYLGLPGRSAEELLGYLKLLARTVTYNNDGCTLVGEGALEVEGFLVVHRRWTGCADLTDQSLWDVYGVSDSGDVIMSALLVTTSLTEAESRQVLTGWALAPEQLPTGPAFRTDSLAEYPRPSWFEPPSGSTPGSSAFP